MFRKKPLRIPVGKIIALIMVIGSFDAFLWRGLLADVPASLPVVEPYIAPMVATIVQDEPKVEVKKHVGEPVRIKIPSIDLDAAIEKVELAKDGSMGVPTDPLDTAWYSLGPRPGEQGSATIAGHVDWLHGATGVFEDLHKVKVGDDIIVKDDQGEFVSFVVRESRRYDPLADAVEVFGSSDGRSHLNIITCDGKWDKSSQQYSKRLVVFADRRIE